MSDSFSLSALIRYINEQGLLVNNLYQEDDGSWRASLRSPGVINDKGERFYEFGRGPTHKEALFDALEKAAA